MNMNSGFFEERTETSTVKATIVQKYFDAWSKIILPTAERFHGGKIAYVDLYAGPGRYRDGAASTPLLILEKALETPRIAAALIAMFNDHDENNTQTLATEIANLPGIERLGQKPIVNRNTVGEDAADYFGQTRRIPTFTFLDPFGYKGLSLKLVNGVIKDWGCDCVFFFNYNRINAGITNPAVKAHMNALFGEARADRLRARVARTKPHLREEMVLEAMSEALHEMGGKFVLPFRFRNDGGRLTHHLVFVSKDFKGYDVMKGIMAKVSTTADQGVPSFAYTPADESMPLLFELTRPLDDLEEMLVTEYAGQRISMDEIYRKHSVGRPFLSKHYKDVLSKLADQGKIQALNPNGGSRRRGTFPGHLLVDFPTRGV